MNKSILIGIFLLMHLMCGCAGLLVRDENDESIVWRSESRRPKWLKSPTKESEDNILFVGISNKHASG